MLKTLFSKIVALFIAILLVSTSITGVMLYIFLGNFASEEKEKLLSDTADSINSMLNDYLTAYYNNYNNPMFAFWEEIYRRMLDNALERESQSTGTVIWIVSTEGEIGIIKGNQAVVREIVQKLTDDTGKIKLQNPAQYKDVMSGSVPMVKE